MEKNSLENSNLEDSDLEDLDDESLIELMNIFEGMKDALTEGDE